MDNKNNKEENSAVEANLKLNERLNEFESEQQSLAEDENADTKINEEFYGNKKVTAPDTYINNNTPAIKIDKKE